VKASTRNITEEHADNYKPQDDDGMQGDKPQDDDEIQDDEAQEDELQEDEDARVIQCFKKRMTVTWMTTVG
jgi:hypothetical protein